MKTQNKRRVVMGALALGIAAAVTLTAGPLKADAASDEAGTASPANVAAADASGVDYRAPGVSFQQFGSAAKLLAEMEDGENVITEPHAQWVFTRAFAWAVYEYAYNRPNYDRWVAQLSDARVQEIMQVSVAQSVAAGRPPVANPLHSAKMARASWASYVQSTMMAAQ